MSIKSFRSQFDEEPATRADSSPSTPDSLDLPTPDPEIADFNNNHGQDKDSPRLSTTSIPLTALSLHFKIKAADLSEDKKSLLLSFEPQDGYPPISILPAVRRTLGESKSIEVTLRAEQILFRDLLATEIR